MKEYDISPNYYYWSDTTYRCFSQVLNWIERHGTCIEEVDDTCPSIGYYSAYSYKIYSWRNRVWTVEKDAYHGQPVITLRSGN